MNRVLEIALRRGFIYPSFEIYGGVSGFYDYGPLGALLKKNVEDLWREFFCLEEGFLEISSPTISPEEVFIASGHVKNFTDPVVSCKKCNSFFRADHLLKNLGIDAEGMSLEDINKTIKERNIKCPDCGGKLSEARSFNLMFKTYIGPGKAKTGYLRPETAQGIFIMFPRIYEFYRRKLPFGVAQIGKAYRNEISPRQGLIRLREFTQAEVEIFIDPQDKTHPEFKKYAQEKLRLLPRDGKEIEITAEDAVKQEIIAHEFLCYYLVHTKKFLLACGIPEERLRFRQHLVEEMAHYAKDCWDAEVYTERFGWIEVVGIADRTDYDLKAHEQESGVELKAFREFKEPKIIRKKVVEPKFQVLGPKFRGKAKKIAELISKLKPEEIEGAEIEVGGERIKIEREFYEVKEVEEKISGESFTPHVIEPSFGIDRIIYSILESSYMERDGKNVLSLSPKVAPIKAAVYPLVKKEPLVRIAMDIFKNLRKNRIYCIYDDNDSIGRRYARADEIGVPFAITVDFESLEDGRATVRFRDTTEQQRVKIEEIPRFILESL